MYKTKPAVGGFFRAGFQKKVCNTSITMPRIQSTTPTVILRRFGLYLVCDKRSDLRRYERAGYACYHCGRVWHAADSEMRHRPDKRRESHYIHACPDCLFLRWNPINDVSTRSIIMPPPAPIPAKIYTIILIYSSITLRDNYFTGCPDVNLSSLTFTGESDII